MAAKKAVRFLLLGVLLIAGANILLPSVQAAAMRDNTGFRYINFDGIKYYRAYDIARYMRLRLNKPNSYYEMYGSAGRMVFNPQKRYGSFNGVVINYDFNPVEHGGELYISSADFFNHVQVLFNPLALKPVGVRTILIDPGHGGKDQGAAGVRSKEKDLTLQIALKLYRRLKNMGYQVYLTRVNDRNLDLSARARACNSIKADLFISIHMNAAVNHSVRGIETFAVTAAGSPSSGAKKIEYSQYPGNAAQANSYALAWNVQNALVKNLRNNDRGVKHARFVVLRETRCPAILVECGFISNRLDEQLLVNGNYQEQLAASIAAGVYNYHKLLQKR